MGMNSEAVNSYKTGLAVWSELANTGRDPAVEQYGLSVGHSKLADVYSHMERATDALEHVRQALAIDLPLSKAEPGNRKKLRKLFIDYVILTKLFNADSAKGLDRDGEQLKAAQSAVDIADQLAATDPNDVRAHTDIRAAQEFLGDVLRRDKRPEEALAHYQRALDVSRKQAESAPGSPIGYENLVMAHHRMARGYVDAGKPEKALDHLREAEAALAVAQKQTPAPARWLSWQYDLERARGLAYTAAGNWPLAIATYRKAIDIGRQTVKNDPNNDDYWNDLRIAYEEIANCYAATGQLPEARQALQDLFDSFRQIATRRPLRADEEETRKNSLEKMARWNRVGQALSPARE
jgi:tetratricopeptide (TPR) repeat protein